MWSHAGIICTGETCKNVAKMTFAKGHLFNFSLEGNTRRAIDFHEGGRVDQEALTTLICAIRDEIKGLLRSRFQSTAAESPRKPLEAQDWRSTLGYVSCPALKAR